MAVLSAATCGSRILQPSRSSDIVMLRSISVRKLECFQWCNVCGGRERYKKLAGRKGELGVVALLLTRCKAPPAAGQRSQPDSISLILLTIFLCFRNSCICQIPKGWREGGVGVVALLTRCRAPCRRLLTPDWRGVTVLLPPNPRSQSTR